MSTCTLTNNNYTYTKNKELDMYLYKLKTVKSQIKQIRVQFAEIAESIINQLSSIKFGCYNKDYIQVPFIGFEQKIDINNYYYFHRIVFDYSSDIWILYRIDSIDCNIVCQDSNLINILNALKINNLDLSSINNDSDYCYDCYDCGIDID